MSVTRAAVWSLLASLCGLGAACSPDEGVPAEATAVDGTSSLDANVDVPVDGTGVGDLPHSDASPEIGSPDGLPVCGRTLSDYVDDGRTHPRRGSGEYEPVGRLSRGALEGSIRAAVAGDESDASRLARNAGYRLCRSERREVMIWVPSRPADGGSVLVIRWTSSAAGLVVGAPHPYFEIRTMVQARAIFERAEARALIVSGTHRCANAAPSSCDGTTRVCSDSEQGYRVSDMAHTLRSSFHVMHRVVADAFSSTVAISLHGFSGGGISLSDGTTDDAGPETPVAKLGRTFETMLGDVEVTYCNDIRGRTRDVRLCGTTNVQGRGLNGVTDACTTDAGSASGRFIHLEQSRSVRSQFGRVAEAVAAWSDSNL